MVFNLRKVGATELMGCSGCIHRIGDVAADLRTVLKRYRASSPTTLISSDGNSV